MKRDDIFRILIVDDDQVDRMAVRRALATGGVQAEIREAGDLASALDALADEPFDCVFLDYNLPGSDGLDVLRKAREAGLEHPVIMLTGQRDTQTAVELMKAGASDYLTKDRLTPERLVQSLRNAVRLHQAERTAREAETRFRIVQETSPDGFVVLNSVRDAHGAIRDFHIEYVNPAASRMAGRSAQELCGQTVLQAYPGLRDSEIFRMCMTVVSAGTADQTEVHYQQDGLDLWLRVTAVKLEDGVAIGLGDISQRKQAERERELALAEKSRFYATMSHELRTPVNAIMGYNELMLAGVYGTVPEGLKQGIERSQRAARHLLDLVNDVLDLSKVEAGKLEVLPEQVYVPTLIDELVSTLGPLAEERGTELKILAEHCPDPIVTDPRRVKQILLNLLSNAIKFGAGKPVTVSCRRVEDGWLELEVVDLGVGIPTTDLARIFEEFVQLPNAQAGGTGLGLAISKRLAEMLGGELQAESTPGAGSLFRLRLPPARHAVLAATTGS